MGENAGKVAPHYHLFVWGVDFITLQAWIAHAWYECCGKLDPEHLVHGTEVEFIRTWRGVRSYASKYIAKADEFPEGFIAQGRAWGFINREAIPWAEAIEVSIFDRQVVRLMRYMRRYSKLKMRCQSPSMTLLCQNPSRWLKLAQLC